jgi:hypothetical protein
MCTKRENKILSCTILQHVADLCVRPNTSQEVTTIQLSRLEIHLETMATGNSFRDIKTISYSIFPKGTEQTMKYKIAITNEKLQTAQK